MKSVITQIKHHVDPYRYPKVQKKYEDLQKKSFQPVRLFGDIVQEMSNVIKERKK